MFSHPFCQQSLVALDNYDTIQQNNISWCGGKYLRFQKPQGPLIGLISYPKSGNTWLRHLIQQSTGYLTGSFYNSSLLEKNGFPGESIHNRSVIVIKSHLGSWYVFVFGVITEIG